MQIIAILALEIKDTSQVQMPYFRFISSTVLVSQFVFSFLKSCSQDDIS